MAEETVPGRRAKIELLVRREGDAGFDVREVSSGPAFVQSRPRRLPPESCELVAVPSRVAAGQPSYILKNTRTDRFIVLSEHERFLWECMDGATSVQDMAVAYVVKYGEFDFEIIPRLIRKLQQAQLLTIAPVSRVRQALERNRHHRAARMVHTALTGLERINISSRNVQPFFGRLYRWGGFLLFTPAALVACLVLAAAGMAAGVVLWRNADAVAAGLGAHPFWSIIVVKLLLLLTVGVHQLVHGLALIHYRRRVREFGFTFLHGIVPTFYVDVTDIFMASRRGRVVTAISGALVHLVFGSLWLLLAVSVPPGFVQAFAAASGLIQWQTFLVALYPFCFIEMDGYHVLVDVLGVPTLKSDALAYVGALLRGRRGTVGRQEALYLTYVGLSALSICAFLAFNVKLVMHAMS
jgi:putative peptide zinc metalloprotease protein